MSGSLDLMIVIIMIMMIVMIMMTMSGSLDLARMILTMKIIRVMTRLVSGTSLTNSGPPDDLCIDNWISAMITGLETKRQGIVMFKQSQYNPSAF